MLRRHLRFIIRRLYRNKIFSVFGILSLSFGLFCALYAFVYIRHELSYDTFFTHSDRIARLETHITYKDGYEFTYAILPSTDIPDWLDEVPEIRRHTRLVQLPDLFVKSDFTQKIIEHHSFAADSNFFRVLDFKLLKGDTKSPLSQPHDVVITKAIARKYFGQENPIGKSLTLRFMDATENLRVSAVMENVPSNSHMKFDFLITPTAYKNLLHFEFSKSFVGYEYLLLTDGYNKKEIETKFLDLERKNDAKNVGVITYKIMPLTRIHLYSSARYEIKQNGNIHYIWYFALITFIILIVSLVNFTSLYLSELKNRDHEFQIRNSLGAYHGQLLLQFMLETTIVSLISLFIAYVAALFILPLFNSVAGVSLTYLSLFTPTCISVMFLSSISIGLICGSYPSFILIRHLKKRPLDESDKELFQQGSVILQFAACSLFITCTIGIYMQVSFIQHKDLGFQRTGIVTVPNVLEKKRQDFINELSADPNIASVSASSYAPGVNKTAGTGRVGIPGSDEKVTCNWISVDYDYFKTFNLHLLKGRTFSKTHPTDTTDAILLNQTAVKALNLEHPVGKKIIFGNKTHTVIGVVKDFNYLSLERKITPVVFFMDQQSYFTLAIKPAPHHSVQSILPDIKKAWYSLIPNTPFEYHFLRDQINKLYKSQQNTRDIFFVFSLLTIFISCLGLFGLTANMVKNRKKEIGIRKVLGAEISDILILLYRKYMLLILISNLLALPLAWLFLRRWLNNFAYRISPGLTPFLLTLVITFAIAFAAISYLTIKTALTNPINSIQTE